MPAEKLLAWALRVIVALLLFIWHQDGNTTRQQVASIDQKLDTIAAELRVDHDQTTRLVGRANDHERRLDLLERVALLAHGRDPAVDSR